MTPLRAHLRHVTAACHMRVDMAFSAFDLATPDGYAAFLVAQSAAVMPVERAIEAAGIKGVLPDWHRRTRRRALGQDLADLGRIAAPSVAVAVPNGAAAMLGMAYVLEGSRHGAAVLLRRVMTAPDGASRSATGFLRHGARDNLWAGFVIQLETALLPDADLAGLTDGAVAAFVAFEHAAMHRHPERANFAESD